MGEKKPSGLIRVAALYAFTKIDNPESLKILLEKVAKGEDLSGTLLIAKEGVNGTIAGTDASLKKILSVFKSDPIFKNLELKFSKAISHPFLRFKIKIKKEIVTIGLPDIDPSTQSGEYIDPSDWNEFIQQEDVLVIDTRNDYETMLGKFKGAVDPCTASFQEFPSWAKKFIKEKADKTKVAMYCTGGIRCEKATSFIKSIGFSEVYHLKGGILKYLEEVPSSESVWEGECFVFDQRVSVSHGLNEGSYVLCHGCRWPVSAVEQKSESYKPGVFCSRCKELTTPEQKKRFEERNKQIKLSKSRGERHLGSKN